MSLVIGIALLALVSGTLIGCVGIGGVVLVPALTFTGMSVHVALAAAMASFVFSGAVGVALYWRSGSIEWGSAAWLGGGAIPGALAGAVLAAHLDGKVLLPLIAIVVIATGIRALRRQKWTAEANHTRLRRRSLVAVGAGVGTLSAMIGTGGPLLLVPLLLWLRMPVRAAVGLGQAIQIPIALMATMGNLLAGQLDPRLGLLLGAGVAIGTALGARIAHAAPLQWVTRLVAVVLLAVGVLVLARSWQSWGGVLSWG
ncbi:MAG: sulfite exporter TauE/SafE family protein [Acetobacteraceae bacterium]